MCSAPQFENEASARSLGKNAQWLMAFLTLTVASWAGATEVVGRLPGSFGVSSFGAANYGIPIEVAAGINGLKPAIGLSYSSSFSDSIIGVRGAVGGFSQITRCSQTLAQDTAILGVRYTTGDRFCLDGNRLVLMSGTYGDSGAVYRTESDNYDRIVSNGTTGGTGQPASFTVQRPNGLKYTYGVATDAKILAPGTAVIRSWALDKIEDKYGNRIIYHYAQNSTSGEYWPTEVRWTLRSGQSEGEARYRIAFEYQTASRTDTRSGYLYGAPWSRTKLLNTIKYYASGSLIHT